MSEPNILQRFIDAAFVAFDTFATDERSRKSIRSIFSEVSIEEDLMLKPGSRRPFCTTCLDQLFADEYHDPILEGLVTSFAAIEKHVHWKPRPVSHSTASENFADNHANGMVIGPGGIIEQRNIMIGASLLAPHVRYPDHNHAPEETYLVMTDGEFRQNDGGWFSPGCGGSFYNPHGIKHAMRSGTTPLFAFWVLRN